MTHLTKSKMRSIAAIGDKCLIGSLPRHCQKGHECSILIKSSI